jgi:transcription elongation factor GreB
MSRAFVKETEQEEPVPAPALELPPGVQNHITPAGAARLRAELADLVAERTRLRLDEGAEARARVATLGHRIAQLEARASTWVETPCPAAPTAAVFGTSVTLADEAGNTRRWQIVGVDEADAAAGRVSFLSPVAEAVLGAAVGDEVVIRTPRGEETFEVVALDGAPPT